MNIEMMKVGCISIAHLSGDDSMRIGEDAYEAHGLDGLAIATDSYSFWVHVAEENQDEARKRGLSTLADVLTFLLDRIKECPMDWVRLDRDAPVLDGLPTYDW